MIFTSLLITTRCVSAHPVTFEGGLATSMISQHGINLWHLNYSLSSSVALGLEYVRLGSEDPSSFGLVRGNYLVKRWHGLGSQGNIYLLSGIGGGSWSKSRLTDQSVRSEEMQHKLGWAWMLGVQADYETRRFYTALMARSIGDHQLTLRQLPYHAMYRIGWAPFTASATELQAWFVAQVAHHSDMEDGSKLPRPSLLMRVFYKSALWELGADFEGRPWIQIMAHF